MNSADRLGERVASLETSVKSIAESVKALAEKVERLVWIIAFFSGAGALGSIGKSLFEILHS